MLVHGGCQAMISWFEQSVVDAGRLRLFCFFVSFIAAFLFIRFSVRMIRAQVRWWPGNVTPGDLHLHHAVFGLFFMCVGGVGGLVASARAASVGPIESCESLSSLSPLRVKIEASMKLF